MKESNFAKAAQLCAGLTAGLGLLAAAGWMSGDLLLAHRIDTLIIWAAIFSAGAVIAAALLARRLGDAQDRAQKAMRQSESRLELQTRQQEALLRISRRIQEIHQPSDLEWVIQVLYEALLFLTSTRVPSTSPINVV